MADLRLVANALDVERAVARHFCYRRNIIVPNVWWGLGLDHECDMLILHSSGYAEEVEIKVAASDIVRDLKKRHRHASNKIRALWFAVPEHLAQHPAIPESAGIISVSLGTWHTALKAETIRKPKQNQGARKITEQERLKLLHLGCMRIWGLKDTIAERIRYRISEGSHK